VTGARSRRYADLEGPTQTEKAGLAKPDGRRSPSDACRRRGRRSGFASVEPRRRRARGQSDRDSGGECALSSNGSPISSLWDKRQPSAARSASASNRASIVTEVDLPDAKHGEVIGRLREYFSETSILVLTLVGPSREGPVRARGRRRWLPAQDGGHPQSCSQAFGPSAAGEFYLQPSLGVELARWHRPRDASGLSPMEQLVLKWIALGHTNPEIARICHVSLRTVEAHRAHLQRKLNRHTRAELVEYVRKVGLVEFDLP